MGQGRSRNVRVRSQSSRGVVRRRRNDERYEEKEEEQRYTSCFELFDTFGFDQKEVRWRFWLVMVSAVGMGGWRERNSRKQLPTSNHPLSFFVFSALPHIHRTRRHLVIVNARSVLRL